MSLIKQKKEFNLVGKPVIRQDGITKVTGKAKFADDYKFDNMFYGVMVRTNSSHAKIKLIDFSALKNNSSVKAIITAVDVPGNKKVGQIKIDQPVFCYDKIITPGDVVAMLVGEEPAVLKELSKKVKIELEELDVLEDPRDALNDNSILIHPENKTNLITHYPLRKGNIEEGFKQCDDIIEQTYTTQLIEHAYIEPECVTAIPGNGKHKVKIIGSIQNPFTTRKVVASALGFNINDVEIIQAELGGSFGGKDDIMNVLSARAAIAALKLNCPVKIKYDREESIIESYKRHPYILNYKVGFTKTGKLVAMKIDLLADGGAYASMSPFVTWRSVVQATGPYEVENVHTDVRVVYTNNPYTGAMRGFGSPQPIFAIESIIDEIAVRVGKNPFEIRELNCFKQNSVTASGQKLNEHEVTLNDVMKKAIDVSSFRTKWSVYKTDSEKIKNSISRHHNKLILGKNDLLNPDQLIRKGIGLSVSYRGCSLGAEGIDNTVAYVSIQSDGSIYLLSGLAENGQGMRTTFSIIAAEVFGVPLDKVIYLEQNTSKISDCGPTVASRATLMGGGAIKIACEELKEKLSQFLISQWNLKSSDKIIFSNGDVFIKGNDSKKIKFDELAHLAFQRKINLSTVGSYKSPKVDWIEETGQGSAYFTYVYGCQVAEVSVNIGTGEVYVNNIWAVHDVGKVINLLGAVGQVYGGTTQGAGYALWEKISTHKGKVRENNFDQFLIPTSKDVDNIHPYFVEGKEIHGPWGGKSLGEPTLELTAAAIANAITNATGQRFFNLPLNIEELLLRKKLYPESLKRGSTS